MKFNKFNIKRTFFYVLISAVFLFLINIFFSFISKTELKNIYTNKNFFICNFYDVGSAGRGASMAKYKFQARNKNYKGAISLATFGSSNPIIGKNYIVAYNSKNPGESICFLNLEVHDSIQHYFKKGSLNKLPIEAYQRTVDSFFLKNLTSGLDKYFPPYYKKEDFLDLEYLWEEEE